jgi:hypothetical protein
MTRNNIMIAKRNKKYKNGSVSMVAVLFGTTVMSLICISFIKAITSGQVQNNMYTQSETAYDASITGINDTQLAISECLNGSDITQGSDKYKACRVLLNSDYSGIGGSFNECQKTIIAVENLLFGKTLTPATDEEKAKIGVIDEESNQSYNCITIEASNKSYQGIIRNGNDDSVVIPIPTKDANYALISYGVGMKKPTGTTNTPLSLTGICGINTYGVDKSLMNRANNLCSGKNFIKSSTSDTDFPTIGFEISQISSDFSINDMTDNSGDTTNAGYLMLAPSAGILSRQTIKNELDVDSGIRVGLAGSVDKANNSPVSINCRHLSSGYALFTGGTKYNCSTDIKLPSPQGGTERNPDNSFIRLTMPSVEMTDGVQFEVSFHEQNTSGNPSTVIKMDRTQYLVSVNGKTGERVRRTEAYIGGMSNDAIVPLWSASVGNGGITKCGENASNKSEDCSNEPTEVKIKRTYTNFTDFYVCENKYYTGKVANENEQHTTPTLKCDFRNIGG